MKNPSLTTFPVIKGQSLTSFLAIRFSGLSVKNASSDSGSSVGVHVNCANRAIVPNTELVESN